MKQVASLTAVSEATLRAWERRYGIVAPSRSSSGYRLYDDAQVAVLREMASLVHAGVPASRAAGLLREEHRRPGPEDVPAGDLIAAATSLDPIGLLTTLEQAFGSAPFEQLASSWLPTQVQRLGDAWERGELGVAQEHFASAELMRAIAGVYTSAQEPDPARPVLVGLPPRAHHHIMLFAFAACLRRLGCAVVYLGQDVPIESWVQAATLARPRAVVLGVSMADDVEQAQATIDGLARVVPPVTVWAGGRRRHDVRGATALPDDVADAAAILHRSLLAGSS